MSKHKPFTEDDLRRNGFIPDGKGGWMKQLVKIHRVNKISDVKSGDENYHEESGTFAHLKAMVDEPNSKMSMKMVEVDMSQPKTLGEGGFALFNEETLSAPTILNHVDALSTDEKAIVKEIQQKMEKVKKGRPAKEE